MRDRSPGAARHGTSYRGAAACAAMACALGCASARSDFGPAGYTSTYGYEIPYERGTKRLLPPAWAIENYRLLDGQWTRKSEAPYLTKYQFIDSTGRNDALLETYTFALRYEHRVHGGVIWLREIPISGKLRDKDLRVLMQTYLNAISGATYDTAQITELSRVTVAQREAAAVLEQGRAVVGGQPAYAATVDLVNVDQAVVAASGHTLRAQLVVIRAPKGEVIEPIKADEVRHEYPVLLFAGYSNLPEDFAAGLEDFHGLLRRLAFSGTSGLTMELAPPPSAPAGGAPVPAAPAPAK